MIPSAAVLNVLITMPFGEAQLDRLRAVSPDLSVSAADPDRADYARTHVLYAGNPPRDLARMATPALGMRVLACKRDPSRRADDGYRLPGTGDPEGTLPQAWFAPARLHDLLARSDVVVMCAPLTPETRAMIGAAELAAMKPSAFFVNVGRGATVDEAALAASLKAGRLAGAAVDVFAEEPPPAGHPLYGALDSVIVSPHVSGFLPSYDDRSPDLFPHTLNRFLAV